jgi:hypothetical protein
MKKRIVAALVSFNSGCLDTTGFLGLQGLFTAQDLAVQQATKTQLLINLTTAKSLGIGVSNSLFARADEVIE